MSWPPPGPMKSNAEVRTRPLYSKAKHAARERACRLLVTLLRNDTDNPETHRHTPGPRLTHTHDTTPTRDAKVCAATSPPHAPRTSPTSEARISEVLSLGAGGWYVFLIPLAQAGNRSRRHVALSSWSHACAALASQTGRRRSLSASCEVPHRSGDTRRPRCACPGHAEPCRARARWLSAGPGGQGSASGPCAAPASASGACADLASASATDRAYRTFSRSRRSPRPRPRWRNDGHCHRVGAGQGRTRSRPRPSVSGRRPWACRI